MFTILKKNPSKFRVEQPPKSNKQRATREKFHLHRNLLLLNCLTSLSFSIFMKLFSIITKNNGYVIRRFLINHLFLLVSSASVYNFSNNNTLPTSSKTVSELTFTFKLKAITHWFKNNKMVVNQDKFQAIIVNKRKKDHSNDNIITDLAIEALSSVRLLVFN